MQVLAHEHHRPGDPNSPLLGRDEADKTLVMVAAARGHHQLVRRVQLRRTGSFASLTY